MSVLYEFNNEHVFSSLKYDICKYKHLLFHVDNVMPFLLKMIRSQPEAIRRLVKSFKMMLGFYGFRLVDAQTGQIHRSHNYQERFHNFNRFVLILYCYYLICVWEWSLLRKVIVHFITFHVVDH